MIVLSTSHFRLKRQKGRSWTFVAKSVWAASFPPGDEHRQQGYSRWLGGDPSGTRRNSVRVECFGGKGRAKTNIVSSARAVCGLWKIWAVDKLLAAGGGGTPPGRSIRYQSKVGG